MIGALQGYIMKKAKRNNHISLLWALLIIILLLALFVGLFLYLRMSAPIRDKVGQTYAPLLLSAQYVNKVGMSLSIFCHKQLL